VSRASAAAVDARLPAGLPPDWGADGRLVWTSYRESSQPVTLDEIPTAWRAEEPSDGPFRRDQLIKQGYLFLLTPQFARRS
jgi:hypothetical protein